MKSNINPSILHIIMGLVLCLVICSYLKLNKETTIVILLIVVLTIYIVENIIKKIFNNKRLRKIKKINKKKNKNNIINKNNTINKTDNIKGCIPKIAMVKMEVPLGDDYPSINDLDECTVDGSCIQKPDDNNLFPGFRKNKKANSKKIQNSKIKKINNIKNKIKNIELNAEKIKNNILVVGNDNIVVENFTGETPHDLNDLTYPFNNEVIKSFDNSKLEYETLENNYTEMSLEDCFHCKKGTCEGGVCGSNNEKNLSELTDHKKNTNNKLMDHAHPYSDSQPIIRITNPGFQDFE